MTFLLDTNVVSEFRKPRPHGAVTAWRRSVPVHQLAITKGRTPGFAGVAVAV